MYDKSQLLGFCNRGLENCGNSSTCKKVFTDFLSARNLKDKAQSEIKYGEWHEGIVCVYGYQKAGYIRCNGVCTDFYNSEDLINLINDAYNKSSDVEVFFMRDFDLENKTNEVKEGKI